MTNISLIAVLKKHGWKTHKTSTLKTWKKERLIEEIQALENNYACALDMSDNQYNLSQKMDEENAKLKLQIIKSLEEGNKQLKQENKRAKVLLKATLDLLQKQKDSHYVLNLLEATSFYDKAECDGYCLFDDIENFLNNGS